MSDTPNTTEDIIRDQIRNQNNDIYNLLINVMNSVTMNNTENNEEVDTIPCEICNQQIAIHNYTVHAQRCLERREIANRIRMNSINRRRELEITQTPHHSFRPISFNFESDLEYSLFESNTNDTMDIGQNETNNVDETDSNISGELPELIDDINHNINNDINHNVNNDDDNNDDNNDNNDDNNSDTSDLPPLINNTEVHELSSPYSDIINIVRNNMNYSNPIYLNLPLILNELTESINNDEPITNLTNIITQLIRINRPEPLNLEKVISSLDENDLKNDENGNPLECPVCYENLNKLKNSQNKGDIQSEPVKILCGHKFCDKCIVKWLEKNSDCPICKSDMRELLQIIEKKK